MRIVHKPLNILNSLFLTIYSLSDKETYKSEHKICELIEELKYEIEKNISKNENFKEIHVNEKLINKNLLQDIAQRTRIRHMQRYIDGTSDFLNTYADPDISNELYIELCRITNQEPYKHSKVTSLKLYEVYTKLLENAYNIGEISAYIRDFFGSVVEYEPVIYTDRKFHKVTYDLINIYNNHDSTDKECHMKFHEFYNELCIEYCLPRRMVSPVKKNDRYFESLLNDLLYRLNRNLEISLNLINRIYKLIDNKSRLIYDIPSELKTKSNLKKYKILYEKCLNARSTCDVSRGSVINLNELTDLYNELFTEYEDYEIFDKDQDLVDNFNDDSKDDSGCMIQ
jgi:hypothetical protein